MALVDQLVEGAAFEAGGDSAALAMADEKLRDVAGPGKLEQRFSRVVAFQDLDVHARRVRNGQSRIQRGLILRRDIRLSYVRDDELSMKSLGDDLSGGHHLLDIGARRDADQDPFVRAEMLADAMALQVIVQLMVDDVGGYD